MKQSLSHAFWDVLCCKSPYRWTTGRNRTITIRASDETINLFDKLATTLNLQKGVVLERALAAFIRETVIDVNG